MLVVSKSSLLTVPSEPVGHFLLLEVYVPLFSGVMENIILL